MCEISVVMPTYNAEKYLKEAIDSILNQTFTDFEFLIIDDNSSDRTREIINSYSDTRIKLIDGDCRGIAAALNKGIDLAKGEYIARMDADDISELNRFERQIETFKNNPNIGILGTLARYIGNIKNEEYFNDSYYTNKLKLFKCGVVDVMTTCVVCHPTVMFNKKLLDYYNLRYNEEYTTSEDQELWSRAVLLLEIYNLNEPLLQYRLSDSNASLLKTEGVKTAYRAKFELFKKVFPQVEMRYFDLASFEEYTRRIYAYANYEGQAPHPSSKQKNSFIENIFSLKNENSHKVLRILFLKFKFKRKNYKQALPLLPVQNQNYIKQVFSKLPNKEINPEKLDIAFIVPSPLKNSGGHRNIYRAIKYLKEFGHNLTVYYTQTTENANTVKQNVSNWFYDMTDIPFICYEGKMGYHDVGIATWWETAYNLKDNLDKVKHPFYMVQDFEPSFYPINTSYILAENSYKFGFNHICSGPWCRDFLVSKYNAKADFFQFPVDTNVYNTNIKRTNKNKSIIFFAKPEFERRCYELGVKILEIFHRLKPDVQIILYGSKNVDEKSLPFKAKVLHMLPTINDLADLYRNADLGIVFSTTNPSLVPYEMMACGCPVADLKLDLALSKYGNDENNVFLFEPEPEKFAHKLAEIIDNDELLEEKANCGKLWVNNNFPTEKEMASVFEELIKKMIWRENVKA